MGRPSRAHRVVEIIRRRTPGREPPIPTSGTPVAGLQPYLGAKGHLVLLSADGKQYVHSHPLDGKWTGGAVVLEAHFPGRGSYKGWGQFRLSDKIHN